VGGRAKVPRRGGGVAKCVGGETITGKLWGSTGKGRFLGCGGGGGKGLKPAILRDGKGKGDPQKYGYGDQKRTPFGEL